MRRLLLPRWMRIFLFGGSVAVVLAAAFEPWVEVPGSQRIGAPYDEFLAIVFSVLAVMVVVFFMTRVEASVAVPILAGLLAVAVLADSVQDPLGPFGGPGPNVHLRWYAWLSIACVIGGGIAVSMLLLNGSGPYAVRRRIGRRERRRARFMLNATSMTPLVAAEGDGFLVLVPTGDKAASDRFKKADWKETRHLERALDVLEAVAGVARRDLFVDVGAHVGTTTVPAVTRFGFRSALALEPEATNFRLLEATITLNDLGARIRTVNVAVSDTVGTMTLRLGSSSGRHQLVERREPGVESVRVPVTTLDALVANGVLDPAHASLLWLDVEGHEPEALAGAQTLLQRAVPVVMEFHPERYDGAQRADALVELLSRHYTHAVDLGHPQPAEFVVPVENLAELGRATKHGPRLTDVLVFQR